MGSHDHERRVKMPHHSAFVGPLRLKWNKVTCKAYSNSPTLDLLPQLPSHVNISILYPEITATKHTDKQSDQINMYIICYICNERLDVQR